MGEAQAMDETKDEDQENAEPAIGRAEDVFQGHDGDRSGDDRFDDLGVDGHVTEGRQGEGDRVSDGEGRDLDQDRLPGPAKQEEAEHEEDVIEPFGEDMFEALLEVAYEGRCHAAIGVVRADAAGRGAGRRLGR